jgi:ABC-type nitrate/sulfonate/bicarbonate transport system substrate-binding protein
MDSKEAGLDPVKPPGFFYRTMAALAAAAAIAVFPSCSEDGHSAKMDTIRIGIPPLEQNLLLYIADREAFFSRNRLKIVIRNYPTGVDAIEGLSKGEVDIAEAAEFSFVRAVSKDADLRIIACNDIFENNYLLARKDRGIKNVSDLKGKRIGVAPGSVAEFYLDRFLSLNGMKAGNAVRVDLEPSRFVRAFAEGKVDAIVAWQPYVYQMLEQVRNVVVWKAQCGLPVFGILIAREPWLMKNGGVVGRFLGSLLEAENVLVHRPEKGIEVLRERLGYDDSYIAGVWPQHRFALSLDQALVIAMEDEARWLGGNKAAGRNPVPDFRLHFYTDGLRAVKPVAVNVLR